MFSQGGQGYAGAVLDPSLWRVDLHFKRQDLIRARRWRREHYCQWRSDSFHQRRDKIQVSFTFIIEPTRILLSWQQTRFFSHWGAAFNKSFKFYGFDFRPSFLEDSEYVPVCLPAFSPSRCIREDGDNVEGNKIFANLKDLHGTRNNQSAEEDSKDLLYHMTSVKEWEAAKVNNNRSINRKFYFKIFRLLFY